MTIQIMCMYRHFPDSYILGYVKNFVYFFLKG